LYQRKIEMTIQIQQAFVIDGKVFATKAEAMDYVRKPQIKAAMNKVTQNDAELTEWLVEHQEQVEMAFETGTIKRVTKSEAKKLADALDHVAAVLEHDKKAAFVVDNIGAIKDSFRWPSVKRMDEAEKATAARNTLAAASEGNEELAEWILANKDAILEAYSAGTVKREISPKATEGLAAYRAKMAAEKAAKEAAAA
jgi:hypothetical protein